MATSSTEDVDLGRDDELAALDTLASTIEENARDERLLARRLRQLRAGRAAGRTWHDLLVRERRPGVLELSTRALRRITEVSAAVRRQLARGLRREGATVPAIAAKFRVSHQRVSALLRPSSASPDQ